MFINRHSVHITNVKLIVQANAMASAKNYIVHKHFRLDSIKLKRAQKALEARTETETVERALELAITEHERSRLAEKANREFLRSGIVIRDVLAALEE